MAHRYSSRTLLRSSDRGGISVERSPQALLGALINGRSNLSWALLGNDSASAFCLPRALKPSGTLISFEPLMVPQGRQRQFGGMFKVTDKWHHWEE